MHLSISSWGLRPLGMVGKYPRGSHHFTQVPSPNPEGIFSHSVHTDFPITGTLPLLDLFGTEIWSVQCARMFSICRGGIAQNYQPQSHQPPNTYLKNNRPLILKTTNHQLSKNGPPTRTTTNH